MAGCQVLEGLRPVFRSDRVSSEFPYQEHSMARSKKVRFTSLSVSELEAREVPAVLAPMQPSWLAVGTDSGVLNEVRVFDAVGNVARDVQPYGPSFSGGVRVA